MQPIRYIHPSSEFRIVKGDITDSGADAVVNAANPQLAGGGGVDGAIQRAAGPQLLEVGRSIVEEGGPVQPGDAVVTPGYELSEYVIHTVGPVWHGGDQDEPEALASAYRSCLDLAQAHDVRHLAFPAISTGAYGFPQDKAAAIALPLLNEAAKDGRIPQISLYIHSEADFRRWAEMAREQLGAPSEGDAT
jgi:O-acetyl-ADP-ribose deacetylase (regulator of RNase III)